jgi:hypothetical protein
LALAVPLSRFTSRVGGGSAFFVRHHYTLMKTFIKKLLAMPRLLGLTIVLCFVFGLFMPFSVCSPSSSFTIFDQRLTGRDLWSYGYAPFLLLMALAFLVAAVGLFRGWGWSRWIIVLLYSSMIPFIFIFGRQHPDEMGGMIVQTVIMGGIWAGFWYWYLFRREKVRIYFHHDA